MLTKAAFFEIKDVVKNGNIVKYYNLKELFFILFKYILKCNFKN